MKRFLALALVGSCFLVVLPGLLAQIKEDTVDFIDPVTKKTDKLVGTIEEESPAGIKIRAGKDLKQVPALAITWVTYRNSRVGAIDFREGSTKETAARKKTTLADKKAGLQEALTAYQKVATNLRDTPGPYRFMLFQVALVKVGLSELEPQNQEALRTALAALTEFKDAHNTGWQIVPALTKLGEMQEKHGNLDAARGAYEALTGIPSAPEDLKREGQLQVALLLVRSKRYDQAEIKLKELIKSASPDDPQRGMLQVYLAESNLAQNKLTQVEPALRAALADSGDSVRIKAAAHNLLGDYFRAQKKDEDALWEYMMVDTLYAQEKEAQAKALYFLSKLFESALRDRFRAQQCQERLADKSFADTEYASKAAREKK